MVMHVHRISELELIRALWHSLLSKDTNSHFIVDIHIWSQKLLLFGIGTLQINYPKHPSSMGMHLENVTLSCLLCFSDFYVTGKHMKVKDY